jgi:hypothetical protein
MNPSLLRKFAITINIFLIIASDLNRHACSNISNEKADSILLVIRFEANIAITDVAVTLAKYNIILTSIIANSINFAITANTVIDFVITL